jgi:hypothetical protein
MLRLPFASVRQPCRGLVRMQDRFSVLRYHLVPLLQLCALFLALLTKEFLFSGVEDVQQLAASSRRGTLIWFAPAT